MTDYSHVTQEMFDAELRRQVSKIASTELLDIPGVYELVSEHFNNDVLSALERRMGTCDSHEGRHDFRNDPDACIGWDEDEPRDLPRLRAMMAEPGPWGDNMATKEIHPNYRAGDPDPTDDHTLPACAAVHRKTGFLCTWPRGHKGEHVAGDSGHILAVWILASE